MARLMEDQVKEFRDVVGIYCWVPREIQAPISTGLRLGDRGKRRTKRRRQTIILRVLEEQANEQRDLHEKHNFAVARTMYFKNLDDALKCVVEEDCYDKEMTEEELKELVKGY